MNNLIMPIESNHIYFLEELGVDLSEVAEIAKDLDKLHDYGMAQFIINWESSFDSVNMFVRKGTDLVFAKVSRSGSVTIWNFGSL